MAFFALVFFFVAIVLIGVGFAVGLVACGIAAILLAVGILSSSVVIGLITRRPSTGVRSFLLQCAVVAGIPAGMVCAWLAHSLFLAYGDSWLILLYGAMGGAVASLIIVLFLDFIFRWLQRWVSRKFGSGIVTTPAV